MTHIATMRYLFLILSIMLSAGTYAQKQIIKPGDDATNYKLKIVTSKESINEVPVADLKGNIIIMQWWDRGCHYSKEDLKSFNGYYKKYGNEVSFYAVSNDPLSSIEKFKERNNYKFTFCQDAAKLENKFFPHTAAGHLVIINRKGICLHHGSFNLSKPLLDTLIAKDHLPSESQKYSIDSYKLKQFRNEFEEYQKSMDSYSQTGFKLEPYNSSIKNETFSYSGSKYYYGYNQPIYNIYRDGLFLKDAHIIISDSLKRKLSAVDTSSLYLVGFNLRKENQFSKVNYRKVFKTYLDSAFGLSTNLITKKEEIIIVTKINEGTNITKTDYIWINEIKGDSMILHDYNAQNLVDQLNSNFPILFYSKVVKQDRYNMHLLLNKDSSNKVQIVNQLKEQGIDSKILQKKVQFLQFLPEKDARSVIYMHTKQNKNIFKAGYKIGLGRSYNDYTDENYQGNKTVAFKSGLFTQIKLNNYLSFQPEINYQTSGCKGNYAKFRMHSITTPINILLTTSQQKPLGFYVKGGGYYSYNFAGKVEGQNLSFGNAIEKNKFGWTWGLGFWLGNNGTIELSFNRSLSNILKNSTIGNVKEKMWILTKVYYF